ncbi:putative reverse transcriptase domain-containing protein [Tanacetum coccineum]
MDLMNRLCKTYLDMFVIAFINDILIYSRNKKEHEEHLMEILELLKKEEFYVKFSKCEFWIPKKMDIQEKDKQSKLKRQNRARERKERERKVKVKSSQSQPRDVDLERA